MDFEFSVVEEGMYKLRLTHFNSARRIDFEQLIKISKDLNIYLKEIKNKIKVKTIEKGAIVYYRQAKKMSDNDNTIFSDIVNVLKRNGVISTDLPSQFSMHFFSDEVKEKYDYIFIIDEKNNPFISIKKELFKLIESDKNERE